MSGGVTVTVQETAVTIAEADLDVTVEVQESSVAVEVATSGPQGATGPRGEDGYVGADGTEGPAGPEGLRGPEGIEGKQGPEGKRGPTGLQGERGPQGELGIVDGLIATVLETTITGSGSLTRVTFDDGSEADPAGYPHMARYTPVGGDRVVLYNAGGVLTIMDRVVPHYWEPNSGTEFISPYDPWVVHLPGQYGELSSTLTTTGWVILSGIAVVPSGTNSAPLMRLPSSHWPQRLAYGLATISVAQAGAPANQRLIEISTDGWVRGLGASSQWPQGGLVSLSDIAFNIDEGAVLSTTSGVWGVGLDTLGMGFGLGGGAAGGNSQAVTIPSAAKPAEATYARTAAGTTTSTTPATSSVVSLAAGASSVQLVLGTGLIRTMDTSRWDTAASTHTWSTPTLLNGYQHGTTPVRYARRSDGVVIFRGRASGGLAGTHAFVLPPGYRPAADQVRAAGYAISASGGVMAAGTTTDIYFTSDLHIATH